MRSCLTPKGTGVAAVAIGSDWLEYVMITTDTAGATLDTATGLTSGTQTPFS